jgi:hypothetical protein
VKLIQEIGSYAGFAAVVGLAVLSALYFSQARDVRRLRDWAGRAPERDAEARARVAAAPNSVQARPGVGAASPAQGQVQGQQQEQAVSAAAAGARPLSAGAATAAGRGGVAAPPRPPGERPSSGSTQILDSSNGQYAEDERWYRRLPGRYVALIIAGVIVVGGGIVFGAISLLGSDSGGGSGKPAASSSTGQGAADSNSATPAKPKPPVIKPASVNVQVFNGTTTPGLGAKYAAEVKAAGFNEPVNAASAPGPGFKADSVVFYKPGAKAKAQLVRKKLNINNIEPLDDVFAPLTNSGVQVVVVVGSDRSSGP